MRTVIRMKAYQPIIRTLQIMNENIIKQKAQPAANAFTAILEEPDYVLPAFMKGDLGILSAAGGTGKSFWMLQAAFQIAACGYCDFDLSGTKVDHADDNFKIGSVLYISLEDSEYQIMRRLKAIKEHWKLNKKSEEWFNEISEDFFHFVSLVGADVSLVDSEGQRTAVLEQIVDYANTGMEKCRLIVIDTLRRSHDCNENDNGAMSSVLRHFEYLAKETGAGVLLIHHEGKGSLKDSEAGASASRGASSITDNARWHMRLQKMTQEEAQKRGIDDEERRRWIKVSNTKANYGEEMHDSWLLRGEEGVLSSSILLDISYEKSQRKGRSNEI